MCVVYAYTTAMSLRDNLIAAAGRSFLKGLSSDFKSRNWSIYAQWLGIFCVPLCIALGVVNLLHVSLIIIFSIICLVQGLLVLFLELPFLLKICPVTDRFTSFVNTFRQNLPRAIFYIILAGIQYGGIGIKATSLIAVAVMFTLTSFSYFMAYIVKQDFTESATLGGDGVAREMIV